MVTCPAGHSSTTDDYCDVCGTRIGGAQPNSAAAPNGSGGARSTVAPTAALPIRNPAAGAPRGAGGESCPDCGTPRTDRFCEECGYDFSMAPTARPDQPPAPQLPPPGPPPAELAPDPAPTRLPPDPVPDLPQTPSAPATPAPATPAAWTAVVNADRDYYEQVLAADGPDASAIAFPPYCPERRIPLTGAQIRIGRRSNSRGVPDIDLSEPPGDPGVSRTHAVLLAQQDGSWTLVDPGSANGTTLNAATEPIGLNVQVPLQDGDRIHVGAWTTITIQRG